MDKNIDCIIFKRNAITQLKSMNDGNDHRYNTKNNLPVKKLNTTKYEELSHISTDEEINTLSRIGRNLYKLNLLKKLLRTDVSEIEKLKDIESSYEKCIGVDKTEDEDDKYEDKHSKYKFNLKAGGLLKDWDFDLHMSNTF